MRSASSIHYNFIQPTEASAAFSQNPLNPTPELSQSTTPGVPPRNVQESAVQPPRGPEDTRNSSSGPTPVVERRDLTRRKAVYVRRDRNPFASDEQYGLFVDLIETHLGTPGCFVGFQTGFKSTPDQILFRHPVVGSTLAVPVSIMLERREHAREIVRKKIEEAAKKWGANGAA